jgi:hypothetical protein
MKPVDHARFIALLNDQFPDVAAGIDSCAAGLLHLEMGAFCRATQAAIDAADRPTVERHFRFIDEVFRHATADVKNAVAVSHLEGLRLDGTMRKLLPPRLEQELRELDAHLDRLFEERQERKTTKESKAT